MMLKRILFGYADARTESAESPQLLKEGFYEYGRVTAEIFQGRRFLVLGPKGSGKSAIAERMRLLSESDYSFFVANCFLSDFPYLDFARIESGFEEPASRLGVSWTWILLLKLAESFASDEKAIASGPPRLTKAIKYLRSRGFLPGGELRDLVTKSNGLTVGAELPAILKMSASGEREYELRNVTLATLTGELREALLSFRSTSRHYLVIDGLDDILSGETVQYQVLEALVRTAARLNMDLMTGGVPAKVILLCRTDLYERLPGPNKSKVRQDYGINLDWMDAPDAPEESQLIRLANLRARLSTGGAVTDVFAQYFPAEIAGTPLLAYLLAYTRHTPRDLLQLLTYVQRHADNDGVTSAQIVAGIQRYATE